MTMTVCTSAWGWLRPVDAVQRLTFVAVEMQEEDDDQEQKLINEGKWQLATELLAGSN